LDLGLLYILHMAQVKENIVKILLSLPRELKESLDQEAKVNGISLSQLIRIKCASVKYQPSFKIKVGDKTFRVLDQPKRRVRTSLK